MSQALPRAGGDMPRVADAAVVGVADARLGEVPFACVECRPGVWPPTAEELKDLVRESLPAPNVPARVDVVGELPRNAALKVRLDAVRELYREPGAESGAGR